MKTYTATQIRIRLISWVSILLLCIGSLSAQKNATTGFVYETSVGYMVGGSGDTYFFTYNAALQASFAAGKNLTDKVILAGKVGIENNKEGIIYPLAIQLKKSFGKKSNQFLQLHAGYGLGSNNHTNENYKYRGGALAGLAYGLDIVQLGQHKIYASLGINLRRAKVVYQPFESSREVISTVDNHFLGLEIGFQF